MAEGKKNYEVRIGLLALASIVALFLGFNFFKGKNIFSREKEYYALFDDVKGLGNSSQVVINGYKIGKVSEIEMQPDRRFKITMVIDKDFKVPEGSTIEQVTADLLSGTKNLELLPTASTKEAPEGSELQAVAAKGLMDGITTGVPGVIENLDRATANADTLLGNFRSVVTDNTGKHVEQILASLELTMQQISILAKSLAQESKNISALLASANGTVGQLEKLSTGLNDGKVDRILNNAEGVTAQMSQAKIQQTIDNLENTTRKLDGLMEKLDRKDGSLGLLVNDPQLYHNLNTTIAELGALSEDLKKHPARYINLSVFPSKSRK